MERLTEAGAHVFDTKVIALLADVEAASGAVDEALALIAQGLEIAERQEMGISLSRLHRIRGDILSARDRGGAEASYRESNRIASEQGARTFELMAALPLAKLLQTNNRPIEAHDALASALEGFAPTPELPQIAEAQALLAALAETEEVKAASASRERRLRLQVSYGQAVMHAQGFAAEETKAAIARVGELATQAGNEEASLYAYYGQWVHNFWRGEFGSAREAAEGFLRDADARRG